MLQGEYLNYIRVQKASDMLRNTDLSVTGVAMACGFSDGNYFGDVVPAADRRISQGIQGRGSLSGTGGWGWES